MTFGHNNKKNAHNKLVIQHNAMMMDDNIITSGYNTLMYVPNNHNIEHNIKIFAQNGMM